MKAFWESWQGRLTALLLVLGGGLLWYAYVPAAQQADDAFSRQFHEPKPYDFEQLVRERETDCIDFNCFSEHFSDITGEYGPEPALRLLVLYQETGKISRSLDDHQLAHRIGRKTAEAFGLNPQAFELCSTAFNYGCQHGYFEYVLGRTETTKDAAQLICESIDGSKPPKSRFYCYHGVGHGVMMARANDIFASVKECDTLGDPTAQDGCWQGAFMENVNAGMRGEAKGGVFSETDPLAPCTNVEEQYRHECFINHAGWLMRFFTNDVAKASAACLEAPGHYQSVCAQSIGLMVTNPAWQPALSRSAAAGNLEAIAWQLCNAFPASLRSDCMVGAVDNLVNFDELKGDRVARFCALAPSGMKDSCWRTFGRGLTSQTGDPAVLRAICEQYADGAYRTACLQGAGIGS